MEGSNAKDILVNNSNKEMSEMQTKNQVEDSIIQESLLTCIDLANSDLHQSALLLKKVCFHLFLLLFLFCKKPMILFGEFLVSGMSG